MDVPIPFRSRWENVPEALQTVDHLLRDLEAASYQFDALAELCKAVLPDPALWLGLKARVADPDPESRIAISGEGRTIDGRIAAWDAASEETHPYEVTTAPSMRMVVSVGDWDDSRWINLTGVSGHAFAPHYDDQTDLWARGDTLAWPFTADAVRAAGEDTLTLEPADPDAAG